MSEERIEEVVVEETETGKKGSKRWILPAILVSGAVAIAVAVKRRKAKETELELEEDLEAELYPDLDEAGDAPSEVIDSEE